MCANPGTVHVNTKDRGGASPADKRRPCLCPAEVRGKHLATAAPLSPNGTLWSPVAPSGARVSAPGVGSMAGFPWGDAGGPPGGGGSSP